MIKRLFTYIVVLLFTLATGCSGDKEQQELMKWRLTLDRNDKRPYGAWLAYESLKFYFPGAVPVPLSRGFRYNNINDNIKDSKFGHNLLVLEGLDFLVSDKEWAALKEFIKEGNEVVLFCNQLDNKLETELNCYEKTSSFDDLFGQDNLTENKSVLNLKERPEIKYGYQGHSIKGYFLSSENLYQSGDSTIRGNSGNNDAESGNDQGDTSSRNQANEKNDNQEPNSPGTQDKETGRVTYFQSPEILGYAGTQPDFVRFKLGDGHLTLHAAPLALSNYFLLQDGNEKYLTAIWQTLPANLNRVYWNDYFDRHPGSSGFDVLWRYPSSKMAVLLAIFVLLVYILFEGKRKQRIIPIHEPLKNESVSFVETVGRLYYNKGNHVNLEEKMVQQFLEWVRNHYYLNTNLLDVHFIQQLTIKSGQTEATVQALTEMISEIKSGGAKTDDAYLYQLYETIHQFYKNHPN